MGGAVVLAPFLSVAQRGCRVRSAASVPYVWWSSSAPRSLSQCASRPSFDRRTALTIPHAQRPQQTAAPMIHRAIIATTSPSALVFRKVRRAAFEGRFRADNLMTTVAKPRPVGRAARPGSTVPGVLLWPSSGALSPPSPLDVSVRSPCGPVHNTCITTRRHSKVLSGTQRHTVLQLNALTSTFASPITRRRSGVRLPQRPPILSPAGPHDFLPRLAAVGSVWAAHR